MVIDETADNKEADRNSRVSKTPTTVGMLGRRQSADRRQTLYDALRVALVAEADICATPGKGVLKRRVGFEATAHREGGVSAQRSGEIAGFAVAPRPLRHHGLEQEASGPSSDSPPRAVRGHGAVPLPRLDRRARQGSWLSSRSAERANSADLSFDDDHIARLAAVARSAA